MLPVFQKKWLKINRTSCFVSTGIMKLKSFFVLSSFLFCLGKGDDCKWSDLMKKPACPEGQDALYWDQKHNGKYTVMCCKSGSDDAVAKQKSAIECRTTSCVPTNTVDVCNSGLGPRYLADGADGKLVEYVETVRDDCTQEDKDSSPGVGALCCPAGSKDVELTTLLGAEKHQFPHFVRLNSANNDGKIEACGGTIYNERYIITASHCVAVDGEIYPAEDGKVFLGMHIQDLNSAVTYKVKKFHVHPNSTRLQKGDNPLLFDIALVELTEDIKFGDRIKALPIAESGFEPLDYSDYALVIGFGTTDTGKGSKKLQKTDTYLRKNEREVGKHGPYKNVANYTDQLMFLGGFQDGIASSGSGKGDSGGPAICRSENGEAVLCGLDSKGKSDAEECVQYKDEKHCIPTAWARVSYFRDWIVGIAGDQKKAVVMREPLFGKYTSKGQYENQVHIEAADGHICGGTLVSKNAVVTAAHCLVTEDGKQRKGLKITAGIGNLEDVKGGQTLDVKNVKVLDGFSRVGKKQRRKRIAVYAANATYTDPFFQNDWAVGILSGSVKIGEDKIAKVSKETREGDDKSFWAKEVAFRTEKKRYGYLTMRDFQILGKKDCQHRLERVKSFNIDIKLDENVWCGVEKYSGGSMCDRELGGGLFCQNDKGEEELCGVQTFRYCELSIPNAFFNVGKYYDWIQSAFK